MNQKPEVMRVLNHLSMAPRRTVARAVYPSWWLVNEGAFDDDMAARYSRELYARNPATLPAVNHVAIQAEMTDRGPALRIGAISVPGPTFLAFLFSRVGTEA